MATHVARAPVGSGRAVSAFFAVIKAAREAPHVAVVILGGFTFVAIFAGLIAPHDPTLPVKGAGVFDPPFWMEGGNMAAPLGTDFQGRDILSRLIYGARVSLIIGITVAVLRSMTRASGGIATAGPTSVMRSPLMTIT